MADKKDVKNNEEVKGEEEKQSAPKMYQYEKKSGVQYARPGQSKPKRFKAYWRNLMNSTQKKMSLGASKISRMISWARGDNWRRGGEGKREHRKPGKK